MPKLTGTTYVLDESGQYVLLNEGDELPEWAEQVGDHLLDGPRPRKRTRRRSTKAQATTPTEDDDAQDGDDEGETDTVDSLVAAHSKDELLALAAEAGAEVSPSATKPDIAQAVLTARAGDDAGEESSEQ